MGLLLAAPESLLMILPVEEACKRFLWWRLLSIDVAISCFNLHAHGFQSNSHILRLCPMLVENTQPSKTLPALWMYAKMCHVAMETAIHDNAAPLGDGSSTTVV